MDLNKLKTVASSILRDEGQELIDASSRISSTVVKACGLIINHPGKIVICGMGKSGLIAQKIAATLCSIGNKAVFLHAAEASHGDLGIYAPGDPTILISKSGSTDELVKLIPILNEFNSPLIGILGNMKSSLVEQMASDFISYGWDDSHIHKIYSGHDKVSNKPITISTWQSIYKENKKFFKRYQCVIGDEAHLFKAKSLTGIMTKLEELEDEISIILAGGQVGRVVVNLN